MVNEEVPEFVIRLRGWHKERLDKHSISKQRKQPRPRLSQRERATILAKTGGRCHICGGDVDLKLFQADHVLAVSAGGLGDPANYLAAHATCNNYRWDYLAEEFQTILKIGVWARTRMEHSATKLDRDMERAYPKVPIKRPTATRAPGSQEA